MPAFEARPGMPYWIDLFSSELRKSSYFYSRILGWDVEGADMPGADNQGADDGSYRVARVQGLPVAGLVAQKTDSTGTDMPDAWVTYFYTTDIERDSEKVAQLGGRVLAEPAQVSLGKMALCADVAGGWFGLFQPSGEDAFVAAGEPGTPVWHEYTCTGDVQAVVDFYRSLFEWGVDHDNGYHVAMQDGAAFAGVWDASDTIPAEVPSFWQTFLGVANVAQVRGRVEELGGEIVRGPENSPFGVLLTVADSTGAVVTLCEVNEPVDEDELDEAESVLEVLDRHQA
ncbi:VOC family protein [Corynebacterium sp. CCUG 65737]|uniref:VOC family protein n=1 Tax=Corynebacterium sp. CCUG 65737 TaxID=2823889 RepID=UPI002109BED7|nr:VOC family protein [Corynebacterium sp. CCUG 65737]MCQ4626985.1 VOC family protein [Corynebacterium sp. CCUG 65737]